MNDRSGVLILAGPTASGKTDLAIELAREFDAEIVGADSRQIYAGMPIGTAAPSAEQLRLVPHHLIGFLKPQERYSAARFAADAMKAIGEIHARGKRAIVAGGTGFYIRALTGGVGLAPQYDEAVRARLSREARVHNAEFLFQWLAVRDPQRASKLYTQDTYRVLRALEVALAPRSSHADRSNELVMPAAFKYFKVYLQIDANELDARIQTRVDAMLAAGFVQEAERVGDAAAGSAVGYPAALAYLNGWSTDRELRRQLVRATRRYAKRQATWFRSEPQLHVIAPRDAATLARERLGWV